MRGPARRCSPPAAPTATRCSARAARVGPDLTGYERSANNLDSILLNVVDPSAAIREEFTAFLIRTTRGQTFAGVITSRGANELTLIDAARQSTTIAKSDIKLEKALPVSTMPKTCSPGWATRSCATCSRT
jgi:putative heme-binding domain-containing protein